MSTRNDTDDETRRSSDDGSYSSGFRNWVRKYSEEEQASGLIILGAILILIPEPITGIIGVVVAAIGVLTWISDWIWG